MYCVDAENGSNESFFFYIVVLTYATPKKVRPVSLCVCVNVCVRLTVVSPCAAIIFGLLLLVTFTLFSVLDLLVGIQSTKDAPAHFLILFWMSNHDKLNID